MWRPVACQAYNQRMRAPLLLSLLLTLCLPSMASASSYGSYKERLVVGVEYPRIYPWDVEPRQQSFLSKSSKRLG